MATATQHSTLPKWQRLLLPAMLGADRADRGDEGASNLPRTLRDWVVDLVIFGGAIAIGAATGWSDHKAAAAWLFVIDVALGVPCIGLLWIRRQRPLLVGWVTVVASAVSGVAGGAAIAALFTVAIYCPPRRTVQLMAAAIAASAIYPALFAPHGSAYDWTSLVFGEFATIVAVIFGSFVRVRRQLVLSLRERAQQAEADQHHRIQEAQLAERTRIAREMHDVLAHRISLLAVHAGALEFNPDAPPEQIAQAAKVIRESARAAQEELREVIGVLRDGPREGPVEPPQPTLADLGRLVEESKAAGMEVTLATALQPDELPPTLGRTIYRLVQEGLTNARKHAPGQPVAIVVAGAQRSGVRVSVTNGPAVGHAGDQEIPPADHVGAGSGLIGLRERVQLIGGTLEAVPQLGGGFKLTATLPWSVDA